MTTKLLILVPTARECEALFDSSPDSAEDTLHLDDETAVGLTGFGLAAAGVWAAKHISRLAPNACLLAGIGGTLAPETLSIGHLIAPEGVMSRGIGAGTGSRHQSAADLGFSESPMGGPELRPIQRAPVEAANGIVVSVAAASGDASEAACHRAVHPKAALEDLETWSVALAAEAMGVPLSVLRSVSNVAGDRDKARWHIEQALEALRPSVHRAAETMTGGGAPC